ncbi:MAG TPA: porin [Verrucomicrobiae bacterium]|nr:porin [Verrucomicrobiae bacterium]
MNTKTVARVLVCGAIAGLMGSASNAADTPGKGIDPLTDALVRKGILTPKEAEEIKAELGEKPANTLNFAWKDGISIQSADKETFNGKLGGRIHFDAGFASQDDDLESLAGQTPAGVEFRRARIALEGELKLSLPTFYKIELDFGGAEVSFKDVFIGFADLPFVGSFQAGHFKEPISLDMLTSSRFIPFMERAAPVEAFAPERNTGAMFQNALLKDRMTWALGAFTESGESGNSELDGTFRVSGRVTALPYWDEASKGRKFVHVGLSGSVIEPSNGEARFRSRPESHLAPRFVDTGAFDADQTYLAAAELAAVVGPFSLQAEYLRNWVSLPGSGEVSFDGYYVLGSFFITGEHRPYKRSSAAFDRIRPRHNFSLTEGGAGAWELLARYSHLNLNDGAISGGEMDDITLGLNWYLNPNTRVMWNYVFSDVERSGVEASAHIFQTRLAVDF